MLGEGPPVRNPSGGQLQYKMIFHQRLPSLGHRQPFFETGFLSGRTNWVLLSE